MAVPNNIVLTPDNALDTDLPIVSNVTGTDIFERPNSTGSYDFSVVNGDWKGGALQGDGFIGDSFVGNGVDSYIEYSISTPADSTEMAYSCYFSINTLGIIQYFFDAKSTDGNHRFSVGMRNDDRIFLYLKDDPNIPGSNELAWRTEPNAKITRISHFGAIGRS